MKRIRLRRHWVAAGAIAGATLAIAGGVAYATIPDGGKVFTACMLKNVGTIRLIDPSLSTSSALQHCTSLETQVSWNQQGQPGAAGAPGAPGPKGEPGRGLGSLQDLAGLPCKTPDFDGVVEVSTSPLSPRSASVALRCSIPNTAVLTVRLSDPGNTEDPSAGGGRVTGGPVDCELIAGTGFKTCVYVVSQGTQLTLTATPVSPSEGWESIFIGWSANECLTPDPSCTFTVTGDRTIDANFSARSR
jgi:hypothetical protein